jgi:hypothetical protein
LLEALIGRLSVFVNYFFRLLFDSIVEILALMGHERPNNIRCCGFQPVIEPIDCREALRLEQKQQGPQRIPPEERIVDPRFGVARGKAVRAAELSKIAEREVPQMLRVATYGVFTSLAGASSPVQSCPPRPIA